MTNFFLYCIKKMSFSGSPKGTPHDWCRRTMKKKSILQWKPMELGGVPQKIDEYFHWGPIFYVCSSARNWVSFMYKVYIIYVIPFGRVATLDVWSSSTRTFQQKNRSPEMTIFFLYCIKKMSFSGSPKGTPHDWCRRTMKKKLFCNENQWNWVVFLKKLMNIFTWDLYSMYVVLQGIGSLSCIKAL